MTICDRYEIAIVLFPFTDVAVQRGRPALVLSNRTFNEAHGHSILTMITTAVHSRWPTDHLIGERQAAGLKTASVIRWKVFTLQNVLISRRIGALAASDRRAVEAGLKRVLCS
jgi:mRNA interferase MazF